MVSDDGLKTLHTSVHLHEYTADELRARKDRKSQSLGFIVLQDSFHSTGIDLSLILNLKNQKATSEAVVTGSPFSILMEHEKRSASIWSKGLC